MMNLRPEDFWSMTLVEWRAALAGFAERYGRKALAEAMCRSEFEALRNRFPDMEIADG